MTGLGAEDDPMDNTAPLPRTTTDPRPAFARAVAAATSVIAGVSPTQLGAPTPCTDMDVDLLLGHLVMVIGRVEAAGHAVPPFEWPSDMVRMGETAALAAWQAGAERATAAWTDDHKLDRSTALPWTTLAGRDVLGIYTNEVVVHTCDLARATGQSVSFPEDVLTVALEAMLAELPVADRAPMWAAAQAAMPAGIPWEDPFGNAVAVPADAPLLTRVLAWSGRQP